MFSRDEFASRLRQERRKVGLNQADFGAIAGVTLQTQSRYEKSETEPPVSYLSALASAGVDIAMLVTGRTGSDLLDAETSELVAMFTRFPDDMRDAVLTLVRAMGRYTVRSGGGSGTSGLLHQQQTDYRGEGE